MESEDYRVIIFNFRFCVFTNSKNCYGSSSLYRNSEFSKLQIGFQVSYNAKLRFMNSEIKNGRTGFRVLSISGFGKTK